MPDHRCPNGGRHAMTGPARRYALTVTVLATVSSLPILTAIAAGSSRVGSAFADSTRPGVTTPFIAPPPPDPVVVVPLPPAALGTSPFSNAAPPWSPAPQVPAVTAGTPALVDPAGLAPMGGRSPTPAAAQTAPGKAAPGMAVPGMVAVPAPSALPPGSRQLAGS